MHLSEQHATISRNAGSHLRAAPHPTASLPRSMVAGPAFRQQDLAKAARELRFARTPAANRIEEGL
jgi:hypothetical protein